LAAPTGVDGSVDEDRVGPFGAEAVDSFLATMSGAVVHNPGDVASGLVGLLVHDFTDETLYWSHPILDRAVWSGRQRRLFSTSSFNTRLFVGRDREVISAQWRERPMARPPKCARRGRGRDRRWPQSWDHEGRSSLARITSQYGDVYLRAIDSSDNRSSLESLNGIGGPPHHLCRISSLGKVCGTVARAEPFGGDVS
jgi:hypothetical protein